MSAGAGPAGGPRTALRLAQRAAFALGLAWLAWLVGSGLWGAARSERGLPAISDPADAHLRRLFERGDWQQAARELRAAMLLDPLPGWKRRFQLGVALARLGETDEAIAELERAARLAPQEAPVYEELGQALRARGEGERAREALARAAALRARPPPGAPPGAPARY